MDLQEAQRKNGITLGRTKAKLLLQSKSKRAPARGASLASGGVNSYSRWGASCCQYRAEGQGGAKGKNVLHTLAEWDR